MYEAWLARTNTAATGAPIITSAKLLALHNAGMAACDGLDGLVDGQIDDPRNCRFDSAVLRCATETDQPSCLTPAQVDAVRKLYAGPTDTHGRRLYPGGQNQLPARAKYDGTGSIDDANNFVPAAPWIAPHDTIRWVGAHLYTKPGPVAP